MKNMKKFASLFLALVMIIVMSITAFADGEVGSITINNAVVGETYTIYQILNLESYNPTEGSEAYSYKAATTSWSEFVNSNGIKDVYVNVDTQGYVRWKEGADVVAFAKLAKAYAETNNIANNGINTATTTNVTFNNLNLGYYLVDTSLGTLCSLDTTTPNVAIMEKNETPVVDKTVQEDYNNSWGYSNDADIGQTVNFKAIINAKRGAENYVLHDKMSTGLTFGNITGVTLNGTAVVNSNYTVNTKNLGDDCTFHVTFTQEFLDTIINDSTIEVSYTATINENAVIGAEGNLNETWLDYADNNSTDHKITKTYVFEVNLFKYTSKTQDETTIDIPLAGAEFVLYKTEDTTNHYAQVADGKFTGWTTDKEQATTLVSPAEGFIYIDGLDMDTYYLEETKAPDGYNIMSPNTIKITMDENGAVGEEVNKVLNTIKILNNTGAKLPETGGIGTTIFYIVGGFMMAGAVVLLVTKKKMSERVE